MSSGGKGGERRSGKGSGRGGDRKDDRGRDAGASPASDRRRIAAVLDRLPPHTVEAEISLLGSILIDPQVIAETLSVVSRGSDFYKPANGAIYEAMLSLYNDAGTIDIVQLHQLLLDRGTLDSVGGVGYLVELANAVPAATNAVRYARMVRDKAVLRGLIEAAGEILQEAYDRPDEARLVLEEAEQRIFRIAQTAEHTQAEALEHLVHEAMRLIEQNEGKVITGVPTGYAELDEMTHGLQHGEMIILAARPSMGKTAFALNIAEQMALQQHGVAVFSLEMGRQQLVYRLLSSRSGVNSQKIRRGMLSREDYQRLYAACDELQQAAIYIDDTPGLTLLQMRAKARRLVQRNGVQAIVIDYLQLMSLGGRVESRQIEIGEISRGVKAMARELNVPVICLSQLNRAAEQREGHRPRMSDLRESGSIEQDADVVMMLHREEYYHQSDPDWAVNNEDKVGVAELIIAKQRNGPTGTVRLTWSSDTTRFKDFSAASPPGGYYEPKGGSGASGDYYGNGGGSGGRSTGDDEPREQGTTSFGHFASRAATGPIDGHRDGGGPDADEDEPPF